MVETPGSGPAWLGSCLHRQPQTPDLKFPCLQRGLITLFTFCKSSTRHSVCVTLPELVADTLVSVAVAQPSERLCLARRLDNQVHGGWPVLNGSRGLRPLSPAVEARSPIGRWLGLDREVCGC